jgi:hypothetical protein
MSRLRPTPRPLPCAPPPTGQLTSIKIGSLRRIPVDAVREYAARLVEQEREAS